MSKNTYSIAVLLPTRGRTNALERSVKTIVNLADRKDKIQLILGFDHDDKIGLPYFQKELEPWLDHQGVAYTVLGFDRLGYAGLNLYYNGLAAEADADWLMVWNDDAIMETQGWDTVIGQYTGEFKLLKAHCHNEHPYSIFPIWPKEWYDLFGHVARHQMIDAELSQNAYMLDLIKIIDLYITHDRADLTGNNLDDTQKSKISFEGNPNDPKDFHHTTYHHARLKDCTTLANYLESKGYDLTFWKNVLVGKQDPWIKMRENDPNNQMHTVQLKQNT